MKHFILIIATLLVNLVNVNGQSISVVKQKSGDLVTHPYSPITNVQIDGESYIINDKDLFCSALKRNGGNYSIVLQKIDPANKYPLDGVKVIFTSSNPSETLVFNPVSFMNEGMVIMVCSMDNNQISEFLNAKYSNIILKYKNGKTLTCPIFHTGAMKAHLNKLFAYKLTP